MLRTKCQVIPLGYTNKKVCSDFGLLVTILSLAVGFKYFKETYHLCCQVRTSALKCPPKHWYLLPRLNGVQPRRPHLNTYHHKNLQTCNRKDFYIAVAVIYGLFRDALAQTIWD